MMKISMTAHTRPLSAALKTQVPFFSPLSANSVHFGSWRPSYPSWYMLHFITHLGQTNSYWLDEYPANQYKGPKNQVKGLKNYLTEHYFKYGGDPKFTSPSDSLFYEAEQTRLDGQITELDYYCTHYTKPTATLASLFWEKEPRPSFLGPEHDQRTVLNEAARSGCLLALKTMVYHGNRTLYHTLKRAFVDGKAVRNVRADEGNLRRTDAYGLTGLHWAVLQFLLRDQLSKAPTDYEGLKDVIRFYKEKDPVVMEEPVKITARPEYRRYKGQTPYEIVKAFEPKTREQKAWRQELLEILPEQTIILRINKLPHAQEYGCYLPPPPNQNVMPLKTKLLHSPIPSTADDVDESSESRPQKRILK